MDPIEQARQQALVIKCQIGDRGALAELFVRHNPRLAYYLRRMLRRDDVADVQQEIWLTVIRRIGRLKNPEAFLVWLYQIARSKAFDRLGDAVREPKAESSSLEPIDDAEPDFSAEDAAEIHRALGELSAEHREVLALRFMEELSYEQIAEVTGCNVGTVRSRLHYAKLALKRQLEKP